MDEKKRVVEVQREGQDAQSFKDVSRFEVNDHHLLSIFKGEDNLLACFASGRWDSVAEVNAQA